MLATLTVLAWRSLAIAAPSGPASVESLEIQADEIEDRTDLRQATARGHVIARSGSFVLRCPQLSYDDVTGEADLKGPILAVDGPNILVASRATMNLHSERVTLFDVRLEQKERVDPAALAAAESVSGALKLGTTLVVVQAQQLQRLGPAHYRIQGVTLTPCACADGHTDCVPDWSISSRHGEVYAGEYSLLSVPALRLHDLALPLLRPPLLYIPLSHRRTGFLMPHFNWQAQNGFLLDEPFYLTLGESYDLTLSAGVITGQPEEKGTGPGAGGVAGPRESLEFRYNPADKLTGRLFLSVIEDHHHDWIPTDGELVPYERGARGSLHLLHTEDFDDHAGLRADVSLVDDARLTSQLTTDILYGAIPATRSAAMAYDRSANGVLAADAVVLQDFSGYFSPTNVHELLFGPGSPRTLARLPALTGELAEIPIGRSPFRFDLEGSLVRDAALGAPSDLVALYQPFSSAGPNTAATITGLPGRVGAERLDLLPSLAAALPANPFVNGSLRLQWRQDLWLFEANPLPGDPDRSGVRGYPIVDLQLGSQLSRSFGNGPNQLRHTLSPELDLRAIPFQLLGGVVPPLWLTPSQGAILDHITGLTVGRQLVLPYDEIDFAPGLTQSASTAPGLQPGTRMGGLAQGALHIDQRFWRSGSQLARLDLGEYFDGNGPAASYGTLLFAYGPFHAGGYGIYSSRPNPCFRPETVGPPEPCTLAEVRLRRLSEAGADFGVVDGRGDSLQGNLSRALAAGAERLSAPEDALFAPALSANDPRWALPDISQASISANVHLAGPINLHGSYSYLLPAGLSTQLTSGVSYTSSQHCLTLDATAILQPPGPGSKLGLAGFFINFNLGALGGGGSL